MFKNIFKFKNKSNDKQVEIKEKLEHQNSKAIFVVENLSLWYKNGRKQALFDISTEIKLNKVTAFIGPSGCGKSTFLRELNRMNDQIEGAISEGNIFLENENIRSKKCQQHY